MLTLTTDLLELRGIESKISKKGSSYFVLFCEVAENGSPVQFICRDYNKLPQGLKKGALINLVLTMNKYKDLDVICVTVV